MIEDSVARRLDRLERENRFLKVAAAVMLAGMIAFGATSPTVGSAPIVEAERVVLKDRSGQVRAAFGIAGDGSPILGFNDTEGTTRILVGFVNGQPRLNLGGKDGSVIWSAP